MTSVEAKTTAKNITKLKSSHAQKLPKFASSEVIEKYIAAYAHLPEQRSAKWKENREKKIGGSELHTFIKSRSVESFVKQKKTSTFNGNVHTAYGTLFENEARKVLEYIFESVVYELPGSIPHTKDDLATFCYSGDGIAEVSADTLLHLIAAGVICDDQKSSGELIKYIKMLDKKTLIVLFEIKCPSKRVPDGTIPDAYIPQVHMGGEVITICDLVVFCDFLFRKCAFVDVFDGFNYDTDFHDKDGNVKFHYDSPIAVGVHTMRDVADMTVAATVDIENLAPIDTDMFTECVAQIHDAIGTIDLGTASYSRFNYAMSGAFCTSPARFKFFELGIIYTLFETCDVTRGCRAKKICELVIDEFNNDCTGLLPWKLLDIKMVGIVPTKKYLAAFAHKAKEFQKLITAS